MPVRLGSGDKVKSECLDPGLPLDTLFTDTTLFSWLAARERPTAMPTVSPGHETADEPRDSTTVYKREPLFGYFRLNLEEKKAFSGQIV
jgi:hypothetical protein